MKKSFLKNIISSFYKESKSQSLTKGDLSEYQNSRILNSSVAFCHAPYNSMYFNVNGEVAPCWLTLDVMEKYPNKSIREIWFGEKFTSLRKTLRKGMNETCKVCLNNIEQGNYVSVLSKLYDYSYEINDYPSVMEFELSNRCNLECIMCKGELSSTIRRFRDNLPPLQSPYDQGFVEQLREFIPHLREAKFLGGEPFLIDVYYEIWDLIAELNPSVKITITTNGTAYSKKIEDLLQKLDFNIIISIDSFNKEIYDKIRLRSDFDKVMANFAKFRSYTKEKGNYFGVSVNPLRLNWHELGDYVNFCNEQEASIWFNTVIYPHDAALWSLPAGKLGEIYSFLSSMKLKNREEGISKEIYNSNCKNFNNLVEVQVKSWWQNAQQKLENKLKIPKEELVPNAGEWLYENVKEYIQNDAYVAPHQKNIRLEHMARVIEQLKLEQKSDYLLELFLKVESESVREMEMLNK